MKRVTVRPGKVVVVSDEAIGRARQGLKAFGVSPADLDQLAAFEGEVSIGDRRYAPIGSTRKSAAGRRDGR